MAGFGKQDPKDVIKEAFGEDVEAVKERLAKLEGMETELKTIKESMATHGTGLEEVKNLIKDLKSPYEKPEDKPEDKKEKPDWYTDAEATYNDRTKPLVSMLLDTRSMIVKNQVRDKINKVHPDLPFDLFEVEIEEIVNKERVDQRANPLLWENVYYVVKGKHHDEIARDKNMKSGKFFMESGSSAIKVEDEQKKPEDLLSAKEKKMAAGMGISEKAWAESKATIVGVS